MTIPQLNTSVIPTQNLQLNQQKDKATWIAQLDNQNTTIEARAVVWIRPKSGWFQGVREFLYNIRLNLAQFFCQKDWQLVKGENQEDIWVSKKEWTQVTSTKPDTTTNKISTLVHKQLSQTQSQAVDRWLQAQSNEDQSIDTVIGATFKEKLAQIPKFDVNQFAATFKDKKITHIHIQSLGSGGQSDVFLVYNVAHKCFEAHAEPQGANTAQWMQQALDLKNGKLKDQNIPGLIQFRSVTVEGDESGQVGIIMEYCPRGTLEQFGLKVGSSMKPQNRSQEDTKKVCKLMLQVGKTIRDLHKLNLVHHDIKPDNILIAEDGTTRVADIVNLVERGKTMYATGTPEYKAPEIISDTLNPFVDKVPADLPQDAWSYGVMLFQLATGKDVIDTKLQDLIGEDGFNSALERHIATEIGKVTDSNMKTLLQGLLSIGPQKRMTMDAAIPYLEKLAT